MANFVEKVVESFTKIRDVASTFQLIKEEAVTNRDEFVVELSRATKYVREVYLNLVCIVNVHKHLVEFYNSDGFFSKKEIRAFSSAISILYGEIKAIQMSIAPRTFEVLSMSSVNVPDFSFVAKLKLDVSRLQFTLILMNQLMFSLLADFDRIVKVIIESKSLIDIENTLYS